LPNIQPIKLLTPNNNKENLGNNIIFTWTKPTLPKINFNPYIRYIFQLSENPDFSTIFYENKYVKDTILNIIGITNAGTKYYWRVSPVIESNQGNWSEIFTFTTLGLPEKINLIQPSDGSTDVPTKPQLNWQTTSSATSYWVQISESPSFDSLKFERQNSGVPPINVIPKLKDKTKYFYPNNVKQKFSKWELVNKLNVESIFAYKLFDQKGNVIGIFAAMDDHDIQKKGIYLDILYIVAERASLELERIEFIKRLNEERERLNVIIQSIADAVIVTDIEGNITLVNRTFEKYYGKKSASIIGKNINNLLFFYDEETSKEIDNPLKEILTNGVAVSREVSAIMQTDLGDRFLIEDSVSPLKDFESKIIGAVLVFRDATSKRKIEAEQAKQARLESVGVLAGGIAHDFNNMLAALNANIQLIKLTETQGVFLDKISKIEQIIKNAENLAQQLLTFSKGSHPVIKKADIKSLVEDSFSFMLRGSSVFYDIKTDSDLWTALIDPGQFAQVLQNIVINARQAIEPGSGKIEAKITNFETDGTDSIYNAGKYIKLVISDDGPGIDKKYLGKIFDPYFSTKESGSGLGLAITYSIVKKHKGYIHVSSEKGKGTSFTILVPATLQKPDVEDSNRVTKISGSNKKIVIMDDDEMIRDSMASLIDHYGFDVYLVSNGNEFLDKYKELLENNEKPSLVFMDVTIPGGMGALETIKKAFEIDPEIKAVVMSGFSEGDAMVNPLKYGFVDILRKPYKLNDLLFLLDKYA